MIANGGWHIVDDVTPTLAFMQCPSERLKGFHEEGFDEVWLQFPGVGALHISADLLNFTSIHDAADKQVVAHDFLNALLVRSIVDRNLELVAHLLFVAITHGFDQQFSQWRFPGRARL